MDGEKTEKFVVIALATSSPHSFENYQIISEGIKFEEKTHKSVDKEVKK